jgi:hypothetical protein
MKRMVWLLALATAMVSCQDRKNDKLAVTNNGPVNQVVNQPGTTSASKETTTIEVLDSLYDFGKIKEGAVAEFSFRFRNTGDKPLVIESASASCGCTVPEKPEKPIMPGEMGFIKVSFNSQGRVGVQNKQVTVIANAAYPGFPMLFLKGEVIGKEAGKE